MNSKISLLILAAACQIATSQQPTTFPNPLGGLPSAFNPLGAFNNNWVRPYYTAAAEGWRTYFDQLQQARNQLYQTLTTLQNTAQNASGAARDTVTQILSAIPVQTKHANDDDETHPQILGDLRPPAGEVPTQHDVIQETQIVQTVKRPQVQSDPLAQPQGQVTVTHTVAQSQPNGRQPQTVGLQGVNSATRPVTSQIATGVVNPQRIPQVGTQVVPQVGSQVVPQLGGQVVPQVGNQVPTWVGK